MNYPMTPQQKGDYLSNVEFARTLFMEFKQKNKDDGINIYQAMWMHHRMRSLAVNMGGFETVQDIINMGASGDIETACVCLQYCQADDMTQSYHWLSQDRLNYLIERMKNHLGWV